MGMMAGSFRSLLVVVVVAACANHHAHDGIDAAVDASYVPDSCAGLACFQFDCSQKHDMSGNPLPPTSISGTVYAPNGTLPLYGVNVYVPATDPGPLADGVQCSQCNQGLQGGALAQTKTDEAGHFVLEGVPATTDVPIVIQVGKWRRQLKLPGVAACQDLAIPTVETTLPKSRTDLTPNSTGVDLPQIAITTGSADAIECLVHKLGIADAEFTTDTQGGRVHLYTGNGVSSFVAGYPGGSGAFSAAPMLWGNSAQLAKYDIVMFSCEGDQFPGTKPQSALQNVHDYAGAGGRVFASHWHNIWIGGDYNDPTHGLPDWEAVATWSFGAAQNEATQLAIVDETVPKGMSYATWLQNVGASPVRDQLTVAQPRYTCAANDPAKSERWLYVDPAQSTPLGKVSVQDLEFTTPQSQPEDQRCGKVVFSDMHVASGSTSPGGGTFPTSCAVGDLTPQEKALAFIFFDISSCVGSIF
jgi:hypothetical protein